MARRGSNAGRQPGLQGVVPAVLDLAALDDLGPRTRFAIVNAPLSTLAYAVVDQVIKKNDEIEKENERLAGLGLPQKPYVDPKDPRLDELFAHHITADQFNRLRSERSMEDARAGVRPLCGIQSAKSLREQRRSERASRRFMR